MEQPQGVEIGDGVFGELGKPLGMRLIFVEQAFLEPQEVDIHHDQMRAKPEQVDRSPVDQAAFRQTNDARRHAVDGGFQHAFFGVAPVWIFHGSPHRCPVLSQAMRGFFVHINVAPPTQGGQAFRNGRAPASKETAHRNRTVEFALRPRIVVAICGRAV